MTGKLLTSSPQEHQGRGSLRQAPACGADRGAEREDLRIGRVFADPDFSASRFAKRARPDFAALLEHIRSGACQVLGLFEGSRGSRKLGEWVALIDECRDRRIRIWIWTDERIYRPWRTNDYDTLARVGVQSATESNLQ
ncbi:recombinase family protein [Micromonospora sp. BRA006-A]|nr:recombinase family protein [Micromonospora sp. BRA006-A]